MTSVTDAPPLTIDRYVLHREIARGGMASIHIARLVGDEGFSRIVAAKRLHPELAEDPEIAAMFLDEARIASKIQHRNVVPVVDVVRSGDEVVLVQEFVHGLSLHALARTARDADTHVPLPVAVSIGCQVLAGLQAAHETVDELGTPLEIVHRDVSPQNVMVALDGTARLLDFGIAKARTGAHVPADGTFQGKLAYAAPEHLRGNATRQSDIYALSVMLWELLAGHRMYEHVESEAELIATVLTDTPPTLTETLASERTWIGPYRWRQMEALEPILARGLASDPTVRWATAAEMAEALAEAVPPAPASDVVAWLEALGHELLEERHRLLAAEEESWRSRAAARDPAPPPAEPARARFWPWLRRGKERRRAPLGLALLGLLAAALVTVAVFLFLASGPGAVTAPTASLAPAAGASAHASAE